MSSITIFCFSTFCVNLLLNPPHEVTQTTLRLRHLERSVEFIDRKLEFFEDQLRLYQELDVNDFRYYASDDAAYEHADPALKAVKDAVKTARNEGRDSSHCYMIATRIIDDTIRNRHYLDIDSCIANFTNAVKKILQKVEPLHESIERTLQYFDETVPNCYKSTDVAECLNTALWRIKEAHRLLEKMVNRFMLEQETYPTLKNDFRKCSNAIGTSIENAASLVQREGILCAKTTGTLIRQST